jgi:ADP-ribose pyrophosphatase
MRDLTEKTISSQTLFEGRMIRLQLDQVLLPDGSTSRREIVKHPGAVAILAVTDEQKLVLVRQFRKPLEKTILEIPAGKLEKGEEPQNCARRELEEETGYRAKEWKHLYSFYTSPGFADECMHLFEAKGLEKGETHPDQDEFVELVELSLEECFARIQSGEICDAKTILAILYWQNQAVNR